MWKRPEAHEHSTNASSLHMAITMGFAAVLIASCQPEGPPALSLAEAKKVSASFEGQSFVPPPNTIEDITAILDQQKPDFRAIAALREKPTVPPPSAEGESLAKFYSRKTEGSRAASAASRPAKDWSQALPS